MAKALKAVAIVLLLVGGGCFGQTIRLDSKNPHYFSFKGKPTLLITSAEHYGAVINKDFDYVQYLDALKAYGLNYTRIYPGALFETVDKYMPGNPLGPKPRSLILPWARSDQPGYTLCGNKFDLDKWNPEYFARLRDFIAKAAERGIVVEICLFNSQYSDTWPICPLNSENNIQGVGKCNFVDAQTMRHPDLVARQDDYVRKLVQEANDFDNVILEICDEPALFTPIPDAAPWVVHFVDVIKRAESTLPKQHLIGQEVQGPPGGPIDLAGNPGVSVVITQYLYNSGDEEMGGLKGLDYEYSHNKAIEENETTWYPPDFSLIRAEFSYKGDKIADSRVEAWEFMVGGGASFNQLNGIFTPADPGGKTPDNAQLLGALRNLKRFLESFDFISMHPDKKFVISGVPAGAHCRAISEPGYQYAVYLHHSEGGNGGNYVATPGHYSESLLLDLPQSTYKMDWIDPATGSVIQSEIVTHDEGPRAFTTPTYTVDIALRIKRI